MVIFLPIFGPDKRRISPDLESGQAIRAHEISTLNRTFSYTLPKTADRLTLLARFTFNWLNP
jgi:hypothetical protein